ncbi:MULTISPECIES: hypothetical protein [Sphingobacterium]|uniref:hypothetical protein n=1 Tax=Sphingobacterium TaxID=28453 RepID=UPI000ED7251F|nr:MULTISPECIES: hypothetical protein [Sphingobacterium]HAF34670.1 hypothetical protein [Sphingobacterium sp.]
MWNNRIKAWGRGTITSIKGSYAAMVTSTQQTGEGEKSIKILYKQDFGQIERISFDFNRYLVFLHKGAGKGVAGSKGSTWETKSGKKKSTNPKSLGKLGTGKRKAKKWLNPQLDRAVPKLADMLLEEKWEGALKAIQLK